MLNRKYNFLRKATAVLVLAAICTATASCGKIPTKKFLGILDDEIEANEISLDDLETLQDVYTLDEDLLAEGVYITESMENIEDRFPSEVNEIIDFCDDRFDLDIDTSTITDGTLYFRKSPEFKNITVIAHLQFESRHAANSIIYGIIAAARAGGSGGGSSVSVEDVRAITRDELYYNGFSRGHILIHCDKHFLNNMVEDSLDDFLDEYLENNDGFARTILAFVGRAAARNMAMDKLRDMYGEYFESDAVIGIYYEWDTIMVVVGYTCDGDIEDIETLCDETGLGNPIDAENSDLIMRFAESFLTGRMTDLMNYMFNRVMERIADR